MDEQECCPLWAGFAARVHPDGGSVYVIRGEALLYLRRDSLRWGYNRPHVRVVEPGGTDCVSCYAATQAAHFPGVGGLTIVTDKSGSRRRAFFLSRQLHGRWRVKPLLAMRRGFMPPPLRVGEVR